MIDKKESFSCGGLRFYFSGNGGKPAQGVLIVLWNNDENEDIPLLQDTLDLAKDRNRVEFVNKLYEKNPQLESEADASKADVLQTLMTYSCVLNMGVQQQDASAGNYSGVYEMTDMGNARMFADLFREKVLFDKTTGKWMAWDGTRWNRENGEIQAQTYCRKVADYWYNEMGKQADSDVRKKIFRHWEYSASANGVRNMLFLVKSEQGISVSYDMLDTDIYLLNLQDVTVDLRTGKTKKHDPKDLITQVANVSYMPKLDSIPIPKWEKSLKKWHPGGDEDGTWDYLQQLMGYCLTGDIGSRLFCIWWGHGKNGKNSFLDPFLLMLGKDYATEAARTLVEAEKFERHPTEIADLWKKRLVVASEPKRGTKLKTGIVKSMTGDVMIKARFMRKDFFEFKTTHKIIMLTQHLPKVEETENAIWDRLHKLPWLTRIQKSEQIQNYADVYLRDEWPGILRWAINGYLKLRNSPQGILFPTKKIERETQEYRDEQNPAKKFVDAMFVLAQGAFTPSTEINKKLSSWIEFSDGDALLTKSDLDRYLTDVGCVNKTKRASGKVERGWFGIGIRSDA